MLGWLNSFRKAGATTRKEFMALCGRYAAGAAFIQTLDRMQYWKGVSVVCPFAYIESVTPFLTYFSKFAEGKNILIASPFVESIPHQLEKNCELIRGVDYSKINFSFYETPITYNTKFADVSAIVGTSNWHEQVDLMCEEIEGLDFDIALLACGSYAMPIGAHIKNKMKKKSIYIGGPLQTFFGIGGCRY